MLKYCVVSQFAIILTLVVLKFVCCETQGGKYNCGNLREFVLVATIDGSLTALELKSGTPCWTTLVNKESFMSSSMSKLKVYENEKRFYLVPSLDGSLFKYNGKELVPLYINVDSLLMASVSIDNTASIVGGKLTNFHGINRLTGELLYRCNMYGCQYSPPIPSENILNIQETVQSVNAFDFIGAKLSWHFRVGELVIKAASNTTVTDRKINENASSHVAKFLIADNKDYVKIISNIKISLHNGYIVMIDEELGKISWLYMTSSPILDVWYVQDKSVHILDPFDRDVDFFSYESSDGVSSGLLFLGTFKNQLFVKQSRKLLVQSQNDGAVSSEISYPIFSPLPVKITLVLHANATKDEKCINVSDETLPVIFPGKELILPNFDSIDYGSYFHVNVTISENTTHCIVNNYIFNSSVTGFSYQWLLALFLIVCMICVTITTWNYICVTITIWNYTFNKVSEANILEDLQMLKNEVTSKETSTESNELEAKNYTSRFQEDFEMLAVLGRGGFGIVMEVKNKIDDCHYAVKRIRVPDLLKNKEHQENVMREVKALAKLDHPGIVRYYNSWLESPPMNWQKEKDAELDICDVSTVESSGESPEKQKKLGILKQNPLKLSEDISLKNESPIFPNVKDSLKETTNDICFQDETQSSSCSHDNKGKDCLIPYSSSDRRVRFYKYAIDSSEDNSDTIDEVQFSNAKQNDSSGLQLGLVFEKDEANENENLDDCYENINSDQLTCKKFRTTQQASPCRSTHASSSTETENICPSFLYIQMQLCQRENLRSWLSVHKDRDYKKVMMYFAQIVDAVEYVHSCGIMHRDLKPSNIYLSLDGTIKIGDFGLATSSVRPQNGKTVEHDLHASHTRGCGTQLYMSPEQSENRYYDYRTDIFSLGLILFELLYPFSTCVERYEVLIAVRSLNISSAYLKKFPLEMKLVKKMLARNPKDRPDALEIKKSIKRIFEHV